MNMDARMMAALLLLAGAAVVLPGLVHSAGTVVADRQFLQQAAQAVSAQVAAAELASRQARDPAVQLYAARMIADHGALRREIELLAARRDVELSQVLLPKDQGELRRLESRKGPEFATEYNRVFAEQGQQMLIALFERASRTASDVELRNFAARALPGLRRNIERTETLPPAIEPVAQMPAALLLRLA